MLRGLTTVSFYADDMAAAEAWYTELLGFAPYYEHAVAGAPAYIEFRIGDYQHELGIIDRRFAPEQSTGPADATMVFWHVDDLEKSLQRLVDLGAVLHAEPREHGPGFVTASVIDPFGNVLGVMYNQHYLDILVGREGA